MALCIILQDGSWGGVDNATVFEWPEDGSLMDVQTPEEVWTAIEDDTAKVIGEFDADGNYALKNSDRISISLSTCHDEVIDGLLMHTEAVVRLAAQTESDRRRRSQPVRTAKRYECPSCATLLGIDQVNDDGINECPDCHQLSAPPKWEAPSES